MASQISFAYIMYINYDGSVVMPYKVNILDHVYGPS